jgi:DNA gyrase subunit A
MGRREKDTVEHFFMAGSHDSILFFTNEGKVYQERAYQMPDVTRQARGLPLINLISLSPKERVTAALAVSDFGRGTYLVMVTKEGRVKRTPIEEFAAVRPSGLIAINLEKGDELGWVKLTGGEDEIILVTEQGQALRFAEEDIRPMGRVARGVMGIRLEEGDAVASMDVVDEKGYLLVVTENGFGKRTPLKHYPRRGRHGKGVLTLDARKIEEVGRVVAGRVVHEADEVTLISADGMVLRLPVGGIPTMGRVRRVVKVMTLREGDRAAALARINNKGVNK